LINKELAESEYPNTMVETPMFVYAPVVTFVTTIKRDTKKREKPKRVFATYCPFCGVMYS
jgi:hypothetical protein